MTRREMLARMGGAVAVAAAAPMVNRGRYRVSAASGAEYSARAIDLVRRSTVIDMLNVFSLGAVFRIAKPNWLLDPASLTAADLQKVRESGWTVLSTAGGVQQYEDVLKYHAIWSGFIAHHSDHFTRVDDPATLDAVKASGKLGIILGTQDAVHFRTLADVDTFHSLGQRVAQLTYNARNLIGNGCTERRDEGLSDYGVQVVERMNALGMAVDVSHCGDRTTLDALEVSRQPVLITHSNARALAPGQPRCKPDDIIRKMAQTGGVMGITGVRNFVRDREPTTLEHLVDHYDHVAKLVGVEHVGTGSDIGMEGYDALPADFQTQLRAAYKSEIAFRDRFDVEGADHHRRTYDLADALIRRGYRDADIELMLGGNFKRVLRQIWGAPAAPQPPA